MNADSEPSAAAPPDGVDEKEAHADVAGDAAQDAPPAREVRRKPSHTHRRRAPRVGSAHTAGPTG